MANPALDDLSAQITQATSVEDSAAALINGISQRITDAVNAAIGNGATADQLKPVSDLGTALKASSDKLQDAITANTPAA